MRKLMFFLLLLLCIVANSQVSVNTEGSSAHPSAMLDVKSNNKGFLPPRMSFDQIQAIPSPAKGLVAYDTTFLCLRVFNGNKWECMTGGAASSATNDPFVAPGSSTGVGYGGTGSSGSDGYDIATDVSGNIYVTGFFSGTMTIGSTSLVSAGGEDMFLAKFNSALSLEWAVRGGSNNNDVGLGIVLDGSGNVYVAGTLLNAASSSFSQVGTSPYNLSGSALDRMFVIKYDPNGLVQWLASMSAAVGNTISGTDLAIDGTGNLFLTGLFSGTIAFSPNLISAGGSDIYLAKLSSSTGAIVWAIKAGGTLGDNPNGITVDQAGNPIVVGRFSGTANFDAFPVVSAGNSDIFLAKFSPVNGAVTWVSAAGGPGIDVGRSVVDWFGNLIVTGSFSDDAMFGWLGPVNADGKDIFVASYTSSGVFDRFFSAGGPFDQEGLKIVVDHNFDLALTGSFFGSLTFSLSSVNGGSVALQSAGYQDMFLAVLDGNLLPKWAKRAGTRYGQDFGRGISVHSAELFVTGAYSGEMNIDNTIFPSPFNVSNFMIWKYAE